MASLATLRHRLAKIAKELRSPEIMAIAAGTLSPDGDMHDRAMEKFDRLVDDLNDVAALKANRFLRAPDQD